MSTLPNTPAGTTSSDQTPALTGDSAGALLDVRNLKKYFPIKRGFFQRHVGDVKAVDDVTFTIRPRETFALVGESGCGKTTVGRCIVRAFEPTAGQLLYHEDHEHAGGNARVRARIRSSNALASEAKGVIDLAKIEEPHLVPYRQEIRMIFQDPFASLNPRMTVFDIVANPLRIHKIASGQELEERVARLLRQVGLSPEYMRRYPHAFSGGQRQRIGIARALALNPRLVVADEAVSALDVSVRAQILNLLLELQRKFDLTYLFISHDLSVIEYLADRVAVMYVGKLVEMADTARLYRTPKHPYTEALLSAIPKPDPERRPQRIVLEGEVADPAHPPSGCYFHPRCRYAQAICKTTRPELRDLGSGHLAACHFAETLSLAGVDSIIRATS